MARRLLALALSVAGVCGRAPAEEKEEACTDGRHRYRVYLPAAYARDGKRLFQTLFTNTPGDGGDFYGMQRWAERRDAILVAVLDTKNGIGSDQNNAATDAVLESVKARYRVHPVLRYTMGLSGGGQVSMRFAARHPDEFAGVCMLAHGGNGEDWHVPRHQAVAFIHGKNDDVYTLKAVRKTAHRMRWRGLPVRLHVGDWGHQPGPLELRERHMDWLMEIAPIIHPKMPPRERVDALKTLVGRVRGDAPLDERASLADEVAGHVMAFGSAAKDFYKAWFDAKHAAAGAAGTDALRFALLSDMAERPWARACDYKQKGKLQEDIRALRKDAAIRREDLARRQFAILQQTEMKYFTEGTTREKLQELAGVYKQFAEKYSGTVAAERALEITEFM